jgi:hypothetical protein
LPATTRRRAFLPLTLVGFFLLAGFGAADDHPVAARRRRRFYARAKPQNSPSSIVSMNSTISTIGPSSNRTQSQIWVRVTTPVPR